MIKILILLVSLLFIYTGLEASAMLKYLSIGKKIAEGAVPFQKINPGGYPKILFLGDSTALGIGAEPDKTVAGYFGAHYPKSHIENISKNGWKIKDLLDNFPSYSHYSFDLAVIEIGANDILKFTSLTLIETELKTLLDKTKPIAKNIAILHSGNIGAAPFFPKPLGALFTWRTKSVREIYKKIAGEKGALYVDLFEERENDAFLKDKQKYYAPDYLHLTGAGYKVWYEKIQSTLKENNIKF